MGMESGNPGGRAKHGIQIPAHRTSHGRLRLCKHIFYSHLLSLMPLFFSVRVNCEAEGDWYMWSNDSQDDVDVRCLFFFFFFCGVF